MIMRYDFLLMIFQDITLDVVKMGNVFMTSYSHRGHQTTTLDFSLIFTARLYFQLFVCICRKILNLYRLEQSNITFTLWCLIEGGVGISGEVGKISKT